MKKLLGILSLFLLVFVITAIQNPKFINPYSMETLQVKIGLFGILGIGAALVIITGGIDLSIGSVVGLTGTLVTYLLQEKGVSPPVAILLAVSLCSVLGLTHGLLITKLRLQPFVVTLCGLLIYRGVARWIAGTRSLGFGEHLEGLTRIVSTEFPLPMKIFGQNYSIPSSFLILLAITVVFSLFLHGTVYGRYLQAIGRNEQAAKYSGIRTDRMKILAYILCSTLASFGGVLLAIDANTVQAASFGNFYELYAIAAAVLGGFTLTGGEGLIVGVVLGTAVLRLLFKATNFLGISDDLEFALVGIVLLAGAIVDEVAKRVVTQIRRQRNAES
jgi:ribose transport system permease protein